MSFETFMKRNNSSQNDTNNPRTLKVKNVSSSRYDAENVSSRSILEKVNTDLEDMKESLYEKIEICCAKYGLYGLELIEQSIAESIANIKTVVNPKKELRYDRMIKTDQLQEYNNPLNSISDVTCPTINESNDIDLDYDMYMASNDENDVNSNNNDFGIDNNLLMALGNLEKLDEQENIKLKSKLEAEAESTKATEEKSLKK